MRLSTVLVLGTFATFASCGGGGRSSGGSGGATTGGTTAAGTGGTGDIRSGTGGARSGTGGATTAATGLPDAGVASGLWSMGYYASWAPDQYPIAEIGWSGLTHIAMAFYLPE